MEILYALPVYPPAIGGGEIHTHRLARELRQVGHRARVVTQWCEQRSDFLLAATLRCAERREYDHESVAVTRLGFSLRERLAMLPWVAAYRAFQSYGWGQPIDAIAARMGDAFASAARTPDVVHAIRIGHGFLLRTAFDFSRRRSLPFVVTPLFHPNRDGRAHRDEERIYREADAVIALTAWERQVMVEKGVPEGRIHVTGVGPILASRWSVERFRNQHGIHAPFVLFLARHVRHKGYEAILRAAPLVWCRHPDLRFVFIGPGTKDSERIFAKESDPRIRQLGVVDEETKAAALAGSEMLCVPSSLESFGGVYTEAWALGKAVIGGLSGAIRCVIEDGVTGLLSSQDPTELAERIHRLLVDRRAADAMGRAGRELVERCYQWPSLAERTLSVYEALRAGRRSTEERWTPTPQ